MSVTPDPKRLELESELKSILGNNNAYFNAPEGTKMHFPCIRFRRTGYNNRYADDKIYFSKKEYELIAIYKDPDDDLADRILMHFEQIRHERQYKSDGFCHDVFRLYY